MLNVIRDYTTRDSPRIPAGEHPLADLPESAVIEDDTCATRWMIADTWPTEANWLDAFKYGVIGLVRCNPSDDGVQVCHKQDVIDHKVIKAGLLTVPDGYWSDRDWLPETLDPSAPVQIEVVRNFVHLHAHSEFSPLDGLSTVKEMVAQAVADNQHALAVTDHGYCSGHPVLQKECDLAGIKPVFGLEAYFVDNRLIKDAEHKDYFHFILWAQTQQGLHNLWAASTESHGSGMYYHPRMDWDILSRYNEGVMASTACLRGPLSRKILMGDEAGAKDDLYRMLAIFPDRLFVELHTNTVDYLDEKTGVRMSQVELNKGLISLANDIGLPLITVADSHYPCKEDLYTHKLWLSTQLNKDVTEDSDLFSGEQDYHVSSTAEIVDAMVGQGIDRDVIIESLKNTIEVADLCNVTIKSRIAKPVYHRTPPPNMDPSLFDSVAEDERVATAKCMEAWKKKIAGKVNEQEYVERWEKEAKLLTVQKFWGYLLIVEDYCAEAHRRRILMGPGRGSAAGSLVCWLLGITAIDPIEADLMFERFLTYGRVSPPDIDSDFPSSKREEMTEYIIDRWGADRVVRVGTHMRLRNKGVVNSLAKALKSTIDIDFRHVEEIKKIIDEVEADSAGLGYPWDKMLALAGDDMVPYIELYPLLFQYGAKLAGRLKTYAKHAAGVVIDPEAPILDRLPNRYDGENGNGNPITTFDMKTLEMLGFLKFDILVLRTLDTLQACIDMIRADGKDGGVELDPWQWRSEVEYADPQVWDMLCDSDTLGVFQVETSAVTKLTKRLQPRSIADLSAIVTLVRPGPTRSGLTDSFIRRRFGEEEVVPSHPLLEPVLRRTYQTMIYQEDIMAVCQVLGGYTLEEADAVRSILGKKLREEAIKEGVRFRERCVNNGVVESDAARIFAQIQEFALYSFNRSHSWSYADLAYWTAWFKCHYPAYYFVALLSTVDKERIPEFVGLARRYGFKVAPPDVNKSGDGFLFIQDDLTVRYGIGSIGGCGKAVVKAIISNAPYSSFEDFLERRGGACNFGHIRTLASLGVFDSIMPAGVHRAQLMAMVETLASGKIEACAHQIDRSIRSVETNCNFDWTSEPVTIGKSGKPLKARPIPKGCTKACRQYSSVSTVEYPLAIPQMTDKEIRDLERDVLGTYVSSTPFDFVNQQGLEEVGCYFGPSTQNLPEGLSSICGLITGVRTREDKYKRSMAFVQLDSFGYELDFPVFSEAWGKFGTSITKDSMVIVALNKDKRGLSLINIVPIQQRDTGGTSGSNEEGHSEDGSTSEEVGSAEVIYDESVFLVG